MIQPNPIKPRSTPYRKQKIIRYPVTSSLSGKHTIFKSTHKKYTWKRVIFIIVFIFLIAGSTFGFMEFHSLKSQIFVKGEGVTTGVLNYSSFKQTVFDWNKFQKPGDGRFNLLLLGIGGITDGGQAHDGTLLTDSIQLLSFDTVNKKLSMTSVPRDFLVTIPGHGPNKINAVYEFGEVDNTGGGGQAIKDELGKILGINISNFAVIDFTAAKEIVDTVGGIDVNVPKSIYDPAFPCDDQINYCPFSIKSGEYHMDGDLALKYMRTRHVDSDFGRSARQQLIMQAIKKKALTIGFLTNPVKVIELINTLGSHIKTDMQPTELKSLAETFRDIPSSNITNNVLDTTDTLGLLNSAVNPYAGDVEVPLNGLTNYSAIRQWFQKNSPDPFIAKEGAHITVINNGASKAQTNNFLQKLQDYGFNASLSSAQTSLLPSTIFSKDIHSMPVTNHYLQEIIGTTVTQGNPANADIDFEIMYTGK